MPILTRRATTASTAVNGKDCPLVSADNDARLRELAAKANGLDAQVQLLLGAAIDRAVAIGKVLAEARPLAQLADPKRGWWGRWVKLNCAFSLRKAQQYGQISRLIILRPDLRQTVSGLTLNAAVTALETAVQSVDKREAVTLAGLKDTIRDLLEAVAGNLVLVQEKCGSEDAFAEWLTNNLGAVAHPDVGWLLAVGWSHPDPCLVPHPTSLKFRLPPLPRGLYPPHSDDERELADGESRNRLRDSFRWGWLKTTRQEAGRVVRFPPSPTKEQKEALVRECAARVREARQQLRAACNGIGTPDTAQSAARDKDGAAPAPAPTALAAARAKIAARRGPQDAAADAGGNV